MKNIRAIHGGITVVLLLFMFLFERRKITGEKDIISFFVADIDGDDQEELLTIHTSVLGQKTDQGELYGNTLNISKDFKLDSSSETVLKENPIYSFDLSYVKPLMVQAGDINGDGKQEISIVAYKETQYHKTLAKRPFFYALTDGNLEKIWLGSRLSRPFTDFVLYDWDGDQIDEIISIENDKDGSFLACVYDWAGFGFDLTSETDACQRSLLFEEKRHKALEGLIIYEGTQKMMLEQQDGKILRKRVGDEKKY